MLHDIMVLLCVLLNVVIVWLLLRYLPHPVASNLLFQEQLRGNRLRSMLWQKCDECSLLKEQLDEAVAHLNKQTAERMEWEKSQNATTDAVDNCKTCGNEYDLALYNRVCPKCGEGMDEEDWPTTNLGQVGEMKWAIKRSTLGHYRLFIDDNFEACGTLKEVIESLKRYEVTL